MAFVFGLQTFWLIDFTKIYQLKGMKPKIKGCTNFYECCDLRKKVYLTYLYADHKHPLLLFCFSFLCVKMKWSLSVVMIRLPRQILFTCSSLNKLVILNFSLLCSQCFFYSAGRQISISDKKCKYNSYNLESHSLGKKHFQNLNQLEDEIFYKR